MNRKLHHFLCKLMFFGKVYPEKKYTIDEIPCHAYMIGYWQQPTIFSTYLPDLSREFSIKKDFISSPTDIQKEILRSENPVCIHFRRGDYVNLSSVGFITLDYYMNAIKILQNKIKNPTFFVFSDDIAWCKNNFIVPNIPTFYVDCISKNDLPTDYFHFNLMMNCHHFIIPNSTYSYWSALLGKHEQKIVIAPKKWHINQQEEQSNIIPANWIPI
ncbi:MAG: alpha-1,2-fucosyltransferase [Lentisphaerae bacterium]|nr:alpha-1,2-fucosyltransferase [Lentisphaerota bacterium]